ncbi:MAG: hypothetical protein UY90_C0005G0008, partial [Candidatus Peregrinibacteria bacterium GW2011_GWA2_54_9]
MDKFLRQSRLARTALSVWRHQSECHAALVRTRVFMCSVSPFDASSALSTSLHRAAQLKTRLRRTIGITLLIGFIFNAILSGNAFSIFNYPFSIQTAYAAEGIYKPISYQGKVVNSDGQAVTDGDYNMRFTIFNAATSGTQLWSETWNTSTQRVTMTGGLFSLYLGTYVTMTGSVDFNSDSLFLQVEYDPGNDDAYEESFTPRRRFASVPYAHNADKVDGLDASQFVRSDADDLLSGSLLIADDGKTSGTAEAGLALEVAGTTSGAIIKAQNQLIASGSLVVQSTVQLRNYASCSIVTTDANGNLGCGSADMLSQTEADARYVQLQGDTMTGGLLINLGGAASASIDSSLALEVVGTMSGRVLHAQDLLTSSGGLVVEGTSTFNGAAIFGSTLRLNGVTYTFPTSDGSASGKVLKTNSAGQLSWSSDTDTNTTYSAGEGLALNGTLFTLLETVTGSLLRAATTLASSGNLVVENNARFNSTVTIGGVTYTFPTSDGSASGKVLKTNSAGQLSWSADTDTNTTYSAGQGLTLGGTVFRLSNAFSGTSLEIIGTASGRILHAQDLLTSSGNLIVESSVVFASLTNCSIVTTSANGTLTCGTGDMIDITEGDARYVNISGDTMTGALAIKKTSGTSTGNTLIVDTIGLVYDATDKRVGIGTASPSSMLDMTMAGVGASVEDTEALSLVNTTSAAAGAQQYSPAVRWQGQGWKTDATAASQSVEFKAYVRPIQGTAAPTAALDFQSSINGGAYTDIFSINSAGYAYLNGPSNVLLESRATAGDFMIGTYMEKPLRFYTWGSSNERMRITSAGLVGIGTTSPGTKLEVAGGITGTSLRLTSLTSCSIITTNSDGTLSCGTGDMIDLTEGDARYVNISGDTMTGALAIKKTSGTATGNTLVVDTKGLVYDATNKRVGIGTASPSYAAHVFADNDSLDGLLVERQVATTLSDHGVLIVRATSEGDMADTFASAIRFEIDDAGTTPQRIAEITAVRDGADNSGMLTFKTSEAGSANQQMVIKSGGNVGIGDTTPGTKLEVAGGITGTSLRLTSLGSCSIVTTSANGTLSCGTGDMIDITEGDARYVNISGDTMTGALAIKKTSGTATGNTLVVDTKGLVYDATNKRVGIGTSSPTEQLDVVGDARVSEDIYIGDEIIHDGDVDTGITFSTDSVSMLAGGVNFLWFLEDDSQDVAHGNLNNADVDFRWDGDTNNNLFRIDAANERVGIGTGTPSTKLEVFGTISGSALHAQSLLTSSGGLVVEGAAVFGSTVRLNGVTYTFPTSDGTASGRILATNGAGTLSWTSAAGAGLVTVAGADARYVMVQGDTMTGGLLINVGGAASASIDSSLALEVVGTMSGRVLHAQDLLTTSGAFIVEGTSTFNGNVLLARATRFSGSLIPSITNKYDLGSGALRFRSLYLSGSSIHIGANGDEAKIGYDTVGDRIVFDADSDGDFDFRMADIGSIDFANVAADAPTDSGYARIFSKGSDSTAGNDSNATMLLHLDNNTTDSAEGKTNANTFYGSCVYSFSSGVKKFGTHSMYLNCLNTYQVYRSGGTNTDDYFVNGDFTVDMWVYEDANTGVRRFLMDSSAYNQMQWGIYIGRTNKLGAEIQLATGRTFTMTGAVTFDTGEWVHVALERDGNDFNLYHSGSLVDTVTDANDLTAMSYHYLMMGNRYPYNWTGDQNFTGYLDETRISTIARYSSASFTPPTGAYDEDSGGLFVRLSDGTLIELGSASAGAAGDGVWTVRSDNNIYYSLGRVGVGTTDPQTLFEVQQSTVDGQAAMLLNQDSSGTGILLDSESTSHPGMAISMLTIAYDNGKALNPHLLFGYANTMDTNLYRSTANTLRTDDSFIVDDSFGVGTEAPETKLEVAGTISGAALTILNGGNSYVLGNVGIGTASPTEKLEVIGTASGRILHAQDLLTSSGGLVVEGATVLNSTLRINGVTYTFPTSDGSASGKVLKTNSA